MPKSMCRMLQRLEQFGAVFSVLHCMEFKVCSVMMAKREAQQNRIDFVAYHPFLF